MNTQVYESTGQPRFLMQHSHVVRVQVDRENFRHFLSVRQNFMLPSLPSLPGIGTGLVKLRARDHDKAKWHLVRWAPGSSVCPQTRG